MRKTLLRMPARKGFPVKGAQAATSEISAGIVIYRRLKTKQEYLLLHYPEGHFDFPKGHIEKGESERQAALRELKEETGIKKIVWIRGFQQKIHYFYRFNGLLMSKNVVFFLGRTTKKKITVSFEHKGYFWLPYKEALQKITYRQAKKVLKKAENFLKNTD